MKRDGIRAVAALTGFGDLLARTSFARSAGAFGIRLNSALLPKEGLRKKPIGGSTMALDISEYIQRRIYMGCYEPVETKWVRTGLKPGMTFVDVGANVGYFTLVARESVGPAGRVFAFEPEQEAFRSLSAMIAENRLEASVKAINAAVGDREGRLRLYRPPKSHGNNDASIMPYVPGMSAFESSMTTLFQVAVSQSIDTIDLLKIDVEGAEFLVLKGASDLARAGRIKAILCEFNPALLNGSGYSERQLDHWFHEHGFTLVDMTRESSYSNRFYRLQQ